MKQKQPLTSLWIPAVVFSALLLVLVFLGSLANDRFNEIIQSLVSSAERHTPAKGVQRIRSLLGESELTIKAYTLTKDKQFMSKFSELTLEINQELAVFNEDSSYYSNEVNSALNELDHLALARLGLFKTIIETGDEFRVARAMDRVKSAVTGLNSDLQTSEEEVVKSEKRKGIFKRRTSIDSKLLAAQVNEKSDSVLNSFQSGLAAITQNEREREARIRQITLILSEDGDRLNSKIDSISAMISLIDQQADANEKAQIAEMAAKSSQAVAVGIITSALLVSVFAIIIFIQVRNSQRLARAEKLASEEAIQLAATKENFVANVSHELRTPLNAIIGFTDLVNESKSELKKKEYQQMITSSAHHLGSLVNDLLDWSKIEAGKFQLETISFSPRQVLDEVKSMTYHSRAKNNNDFIIESNIESSFLLGDPTRLKQILINIIGNAFKFTENGTVTIKVTEESNEKMQNLNIVISDTGIGIPKDKIKDVFGDFHQLDSSTSRKFGGSGLGLAITKKLVTLKGGDISVTSEENQGTTFTMNIPYAKGNKVSEPISKPTLNIDAQRILIVDDSKINRKLLRAIFKNNKCDLVDFESPLQALEALRTETFDFGLFDIKMPDMDGFELVEKAKAITGDRTKYIALTAAPTKDILSKGLDAGYSAVIAKPIDRTKLFQVLQGNEISSTEEWLKEEHSQQASAIDQKLINDIFDNDISFRNEMLEVFIATFEVELPKAKKAIANRAFIDLDNIAHRLIPSSRQIGAKRITNALIHLKDGAKEQVSSELLIEYWEELSDALEKVKTEISALINQKSE